MPAACGSMCFPIWVCLKAQLLHDVWEPHISLTFAQRNVWVLFPSLRRHTMSHLIIFDHVNCVHQAIHNLACLVTPHYIASSESSSPSHPASHLIGPHHASLCLATPRHTWPFLITFCHFWSRLHAPSLAHHVISQHDIINNTFCFLTGISLLILPHTVMANQSPSSLILPTTHFTIHQYPCPSQTPCLSKLNYKK